MWEFHVDLHWKSAAPSCFCWNVFDGQAPGKPRAICAWPQGATFLVGFAALSVKLKLLDDASRALMQKLANSWAKHGTACAKSISCRKYKSMHAYIHTMPYHVIPYVYHYISIEMYTILTVAYTCTYSYVCITLKHYTIITITLHSIWTQHRINVFYLLRIYIYIYHHLVIKPRHSPPPQHILEPRNCTMWLGNKQHGWNWDDHSLSVIRGAMWNPTGTKNSQRRSCLGRLGRSCDHFSWNFCILKIPGQTDLPQIRNDGQCTLLILYYPILIYLKAVSRFFSMSWIWECSPIEC